jgi:light-regulated signal transduction histidine kinase (bacteriophytochrome)
MLDITTLRDVERKLEESNATKDKFFTIIAYDLKNPFNGILGFSQLIIDNENECDFNHEEIYSFVKIINETAHYAYTIGLTVAFIGCLVASSGCLFVFVGCFVGNVYIYSIQ